MPTYVSTHGGVWIGRRHVAQGEQFEATPEQVAGMSVALVPVAAPVAPKPAPVPLAVKKAKATP